MDQAFESFTSQLARRLDEDPPKRKGDRTRERLKLAAAQVLEQVGFYAMRVTDITEAASASEGTFYIYFEDKTDIALAVLHEFLSGVQDTGPAHSTERKTLFSTVRDANMRWIGIVRANAGLMRCVFQMSDDDPAFSQLVHSYNRAWYERIARSVVRHHAPQKIEFTTALFTAWALGAMMDELMRRMVIYPDESFVAFLGAVAPDDDALADALTVIWFRVLYPASELPSELDGLARALAEFVHIPDATRRRSRLS
ncbi:MAG: TetR/AcrR family transcriptional regulator [Pseudomonadota bacterium]